MTSIKPTPEELRTGAFSPETLLTARNAILDDGMVVLEGVADVDHLIAIREQMLSEVDKVLSRTDTPFNFVKANIQQDPPPTPPFLFKDVLLNDLIIQVTHSVLGDGLFNAFYSGNTALANSGQRQPTHFDMGHLWPGLYGPPYCLVVNFPLVDMDASNGAIELWPGTHKIPFGDWRSADIKIPDEMLEEQRPISKPFQPSVKLGSALIRDIRLWHGGMPNPSPNHRPMVAMIHYAAFFPCGPGPEFPASCKGFFEHPVLETRAHWVEGAIDHTLHNTAFDYAEKG